MSTRPAEKQQPEALAPTEALQQVVEQVAKDARRDPEAFLLETAVPEGGE